MRHWPGWVRRSQGPGGSRRLTAAGQEVITWSLCAGREGGGERRNRRGAALLSGAAGDGRRGAGTAVWSALRTDDNTPGSWTRSRPGRAQSRPRRPGRRGPDGQCPPSPGPPAADQLRPVPRIEGHRLTSRGNIQPPRHQRLPGQRGAATAGRVVPGVPAGGLHVRQRPAPALRRAGQHPGGVSVEVRRLVV